MECIKYINDLELEIQMLNDLKENRLNDNQDCSEFDEKIQQKQELIDKCKLNLEKISNNQICYKLYLNMLNGMSPSQAVSKVAEDNYINGIKPTEVRNIWGTYYKKLKKELKRQ